MNKREPPISKADGTTFEILAERVKDVHNATSSVAKGAVNQLLTIRLSNMESLNSHHFCFVTEISLMHLSNLSSPFVFTIVPLMASVF